jgi:peptidoglycan-associated lipoprotein
MLVGWKQGARVAIVAAVLATGLGLAGCATGFGKPKVATVNPCEDLKVAIYFEQDSAAISREAKAVLKEAAAMRGACAVGVVEVLGLADAVGDPRANLALSEKRAKAVTVTLGGLGFGKVHIAAAGDTGSTTAAGEVLPLRRRADVVFKSSGG